MDGKEHSHENAKTRSPWSKQMKPVRLSCGRSRNIPAPARLFKAGGCLPRQPCCARKCHQEFSCIV